MSVVYAYIAATKEHPFGGSIIAYR